MYEIREIYKYFGEEKEDKQELSLIKNILFEMADDKNRRNENELSNAV